RKAAAPIGVGSVLAQGPVAGPNSAAVWTGQRRLAGIGVALAAGVGHIAEEVVLHIGGADELAIGARLESGTASAQRVALPWPYDIERMRRLISLDQGLVGRE